VTRRDAAREACRRLSLAVAEVTPPGLGHWPDAWLIVAAPSDAFLDALLSWEDAGTVEHLAAAKAAGRELLDAWRAAAAAWEAAGRPRAAHRPEEPAHA
jgi:hypothetical protein